MLFFKDCKKINCDNRCGLLTFSYSERGSRKIGSQIVFTKCDIFRCDLCFLENIQKVSYKYLDWIRVEMFTSLGNEATLFVTGAETNSARAMLEFLQNERYWSIRFEVKYSSLFSKNRRIDLLLIEFVRLRVSLPENCISDSRARFDAIDHFSGTRESLDS